jgi:uracil-DNA glycosylase
MSQTCDTYLENYFGEWLKVLDRTELINAMTRIELEYRSKSLCPEQHNVFKAFKLCPFRDLKVVLLAQDPYPQKGVATGIVFGNKNNTKEEDYSPSLSIIKESVIDYEINHGHIIFDPTLEKWASQGVLMLNSSLTTECNKIGVHYNIWSPFIRTLMINLSKNLTGIIYVLFGNQAKTFKPYINANTNVILEEYHPAYYARIGKKMPSTLFRTIDKLLIGKYGETIKWYSEF